MISGAGNVQTEILNLNAPFVVNNPIPVDSIAAQRFIDIATGVRHSLAITEKGHIYAWGANDYGQIAQDDSKLLKMHDTRTGGEFGYIDKPSLVSLDHVPASGYAA